MTNQSEAVGPLTEDHWHKWTCAEADAARVGLTQRQIVALGEIVAATTWERTNPHGYVCQSCGRQTVETPFAIEHEDDCEAEIARTALAALASPSPEPLTPESVGKWAKDHGLRLTLATPSPEPLDHRTTLARLAPSRQEAVPGDRLRAGRIATAIKASAGRLNLSYAQEDHLPAFTGAVLAALAASPADGLDVERLLCVFCGRKVPPPIEAHFDREHWTRDLLDTYVSEGRIEPGDAESLRGWIGARIAAAVRESAPSEDEYPVLNVTKGTTLVFPDGSSVIVTTQNGRYILADHMDVVP